MPLKPGHRSNRQNLYNLSHDMALIKRKSSAMLRRPDILKIPEDINLHQRRCDNQKYLQTLNSVLRRYTNCIRSGQQYFLVTTVTLQLFF